MKERSRVKSVSFKTVWPLNYHYSRVFPTFLYWQTLTCILCFLSISCAFCLCCLCCLNFLCCICRICCILGSVSGSRPERSWSSSGNTSRRRTGQDRTSQVPTRRMCTKYGGPGAVTASCAALCAAKAAVTPPQRLRSGAGTVSTG